MRLSAGYRILCAEQRAKRQSEYLYNGNIQVPKELKCRTQDGSHGKNVCLLDTKTEGDEKSSWPMANCAYCF
jgi:hypothetical protein